MGNRTNAWSVVSGNEIPRNGVKIQMKFLDQASSLIKHACPGATFAELSYESTGGLNLHMTLNLGLSPGDLSLKDMNAFAKALVAVIDAAGEVLAAKRLAMLQEKLNDLQKQYDNDKARLDSELQKMQRYRDYYEMSRGVK